MAFISAERRPARGRGSPQHLLGPYCPHPFSAWISDSGAGCGAAYVSTFIVVGEPPETVKDPSVTPASGGIV